MVALPVTFTKPPTLGALMPNSLQGKVREPATSIVDPDELNSVGQDRWAIRIRHRRAEGGVRPCWEFAESLRRGWRSESAFRGNTRSSRKCRDADAIGVQRHSFPLRHSGALIITVLAAIDVAYRLLFRESLRRALGMRS
jgi:hypothetical protein